MASLGYFFPYRNDNATNQNAVIRCETRHYHSAPNLLYIGVSHLDGHVWMK